MTIFIKTKFKISDDQTNIDKYILAANITEYHIISKLILQRIIIQRVIWSKFKYWIWSPHRISKSKKNISWYFRFIITCIPLAGVGGLVLLSITTSCWPPGLLVGLDPTPEPDISKNILRIRVLIHSAF